MSTCAKCKQLQTKTKYICDFICESTKENNSQIIRKIKQVELCLNCWKKMMKNEEAFVKEFKIKKDDELKEDREMTQI